VLLVVEQVLQTMVELVLLVDQVVEEEEHLVLVEQFNLVELPQEQQEHHQILYLQHLDGEILAELEVILVEGITMDLVEAVVVLLVLEVMPLLELVVLEVME
jgi:hypothetical protein